MSVVVCGLQVYGVGKFGDVPLGVLIQGSNRINWLFLTLDDF